MSQTESAAARLPSGPAAAAILAASIGTFIMGLLALLSEIGAFASPALYPPAGGLSGKAVITVVVWLIVWAGLHSRWSRRDVDLGRVSTAAFILIALGLVGTWPPLWHLFE